MLETKPDNKNFLTKPLMICIIALLCCALWGSATPFIKIGYNLMLKEVTPASTILFAGIRFTLAGMLTIAFYSLARKRFVRPNVKNIDKVVYVSLFQTIIQYIFFYIGVSNTSAIKGTVLSGSTAFWCIVVSCLIFRQEKMSLKKIIACIIGFAGIIIVNLDGLDLNMNFTGDGFVLFATVSYAVSSSLMKMFSKYEDPVILSGYQFLLGGVVMSILGLVLGGKITITSFGAFAVLIYLAFLSATAYALWGLLLKYNPVSKVTIFSFTTPILGVILSSILLDESGNINPVNLLIALVLICLGIIIVNYSPNKDAKTVSADK